MFDGLQFLQKIEGVHAIALLSLYLLSFSIKNLSTSTAVQESLLVYHIKNYELPLSLKEECREILTKIFNKLVSPRPL
jgi:hypothetical protein